MRITNLEVLNVLIALDIGNTNITIGVFENKELKATWRLATDARKMPDEYMLSLMTLLPMKGIRPEEIDSAVICSVVPTLNTAFEDLVQRCFSALPLLIGPGVRTGLRILYEPPRDVGADRVVDAVAAFHLYGGPVIIVDFGTATVFDAVSENGDYLGGALSPGVHSAAEALFLNTSQLRRVELSAPPTAIGKSTVHAMQSGLLFGYSELVAGMVRRFSQEIGGSPKVIATGGLAGIIAKEVDIFDAVNPDLTLIGLRIIYEMNQT
jgi:type III pantothenate kinase